MEGHRLLRPTISFDEQKKIEPYDKNNFIYAHIPSLSVVFLSSNQ